MELTAFTDYALRILMFLAAEPARKSSIDELSQFYGISRHHVAKITRRLAEHGFLDTSKGKSGGLRLNRDAAEINLADVIRVTEPHFNLVSCFSGQEGVCILEGNCRLKGILIGARGQFFTYLAKYTLADAISGSHKVLTPSN